MEYLSCVEWSAFILHQENNFKCITYSASDNCLDFNFRTSFSFASSAHSLEYCEFSRPRDALKDKTQQ